VNAPARRLVDAPAGTGSVNAPARWLVDAPADRRAGGRPPASCDAVLALSLTEPATGR